MVEFSKVRQIYETAKETGRYNQAATVLRQLACNLDELQNTRQTGLFDFGVKT